MYQKSPFPYLLLFVFIMIGASFSNLTINRKIEAPIVYKIDLKTIHTDFEMAKSYEFVQDSIQLASIR